MEELDDLVQTVVTPEGASESVPDGAAARGHLQLVVIGPGALATHRLTDGAVLTIGRSSRSEIVIDDESISRRHAVLRLGARITLEDLGSVNGTRLRGTRLAPGRPTPIAVGEVIRIGTVSVSLQQHARAGVAHAAPEGLAAGATAIGTVAPATTTTAARIVVADPQMQSLHRLIAQIAGSQIGVLLLGETGVGKEVFAHAVHHASPRAAGPFVEINCAALTETLLESELFGHEKGAFTSAQAAKPGLIETAHGGTLFLDEIGDMPMGTQVKLLRVIENAELRRVGGLKPRTIDVRFVAATNCDLEALIARGTFRRDLFYRLNGVTLLIPALRQRRSEIAPLTDAFIRRAWTRASAPPPVTAEARAALEAYPWPGNIRELKNVIERAMLLCDGGPIQREHLPPAMLQPAPAAGAPRAADATIDAAPDSMPGAAPHATTGPDAPTACAPPPRRGGSDDVFAADVLGVPRRNRADEQRLILDALDRAGGNQTRAAQLLGISRRTLVNRLDEYDIARPRKPRKTEREPLA